MSDHAVPDPDELPFVPAPLHVERRPGDPFRLRPGTVVVVSPRAEAVSTAVLVAERITHMCGFPVAVVQGSVPAGTEGAVVLRLATDPAAVDLPPGTPPDVAEDAYRVDVDAHRAVVTALAPAGLVRGARTLQQASRRPDADGWWSFPPFTVVDRPRFGWRGLSLDVARHFFAPAVVRRVIDLASTYKLNVLHLHLTDDQGWRVPIAGRPELTERSGPTAVDGDPGGAYTAADWTELLAYAATRHVTVVPEVDLPGHVNAALHAVPELNPDGRPAAVYTGTDVGFSRLTLDLPATRPFLAQVLGGLAAMTTGPFVHVGGDEVLTMDRDEYVRLVRAAATEVVAAGKRVVAWQEAAVAGLPRGSVVQLWDEREGHEAVVAAARAGCGVLLSPASRVYLDMRYEPSFPLGTDWAGTIDLRRAYEWEPDDVVPDLPPRAVVGVEAAVWTETIRTPEELFRMLLPRLAAVAEVAWSAPGRRSWDSFATRVAAHSWRWDQAGYAWHPDPAVTW